MIIKSITLGNYRLYEGKNIIKFNQDDEKPIFLISGENGFPDFVNEAPYIALSQTAISPWLEICPKKVIAR